MSWFGSRGSSTASNSNETQGVNKQKHKQIENLKEQVSGVLEIIRDEEYRVTTTIQGNPLTLNITLPARFPLIGPDVTVSPPVKHPWVNEQMLVIGSPLIKNFTVHSKLGRVIDQVIKEFNEHPPTFLMSSTAPQTIIPPYPLNSAEMPMPPIINHSGGYAPYTYSSAPQTASSVGATQSPEVRPKRPVPTPPNAVATSSATYKPPPLPESFEEVKNMSKEELERYMSDLEGTVLIEQLVSEHDVIKKVRVDREAIFQENEYQASINLEHEPELQEGWTQLQEKYLEMEALKQKHEKMLKEQRYLVERYQSQPITARLKSLANEADNQSEICADDFLDNKMKANEFIQKYQQLRKLHHIRKTKFEKLSYK